jgi:hypothetical protein
MASWPLSARPSAVHDRRPPSAARIVTVHAPTVSARTIRLLDVAVAAWAVFWVVVGVLAAVEVDHLGTLADTVAHTADSLRSTVSALAALSHLPIVGGSLAAVVRTVGASAATAHAQAVAAHTTIDHLSLLVGVALAAGQATLALLLYLPLRLPWRRDVAEVRRALATDPDDPVLGLYLARRALAGMSLAQARAVGDDPWSEAAAGDVWPLAEVELRRLGLQRQKTGEDRRTGVGRRRAKEVR